MVTGRKSIHVSYVELGTIGLYHMDLIGRNIVKVVILVLYPTYHLLSLANLA